MKKSHKLYVDGACRGNPGIGGAGAYLEDSSGNEVVSEKKYLGHCTNNIAEYEALLLGLKTAQEHKIKYLRIFADSELLVKQIRGEYKVKNEFLKKKYQEALKLLAKFQFEISHVLRDKNKKADQLANDAIDEQQVFENE